MKGARTVLRGRWASNGSPLPDNLEQQELLADFLPYADVVELPAPWPDLPVCRDEKDQVFLVLAHVGKADALITGDADILAMREDFPGLIMTAEAFAARQA
ncbi:putative toxin-antitoxin system toxin component, PIN family [Pseudomonas aeruginosa]|nr:putative toxin-antitoxin system toxin component, PIN family [Pseudomonas aeruginosa]WMX11450.1 putative toxin-antitoxin system toxin component, PIN family [Pseudomonas aeruginosa]